MRYKVNFQKRFGPDGKPELNPMDSLNLPEGLVCEALIAESETPPSLHSEERIEEDDDFLSLGTEAWEFEIAPGREQEFLNILRDSGVALEYEELGDAA